MRQLLVISILLLVLTGCQTAPLDQFSKVQMTSSKDAVLELLGSPNRTEMIEGKEKWSYRFYSGENKEQEILRQITFFQGRVISYGPDNEEISRLQQIKDSDEKRAGAYKAEKDARKARPAFVYPPRQDAPIKK